MILALSPFLAKFLEVPDANRPVVAPAVPAPVPGPGRKAGPGRLRGGRPAEARRRAGPAELTDARARPPLRKWLAYLPDRKGLRKVEAGTRSEARAALKRQEGLDRLPSGSKVVAEDHKADLVDYLVS